jgi:hypothetical protein
MVVIIDVLLPAGLIALLVFAFGSLLANTRTKALRDEVETLSKANKVLTTGSTTREDDLRKSLELAEADVAQLNEALDAIMSAIAGRPNPLDLCGPYQPIVTIIEAKRPRRHPHH